MGHDAMLSGRAASDKPVSDTSHPLFP
jgi:hypothetical protein